MAEIITGDTTKGIKNVGELALRISKFDSYRLFTLYENVKEGKVMNVSGDQKYYLVFKSPKKEVRIPEYDPKGFFEVDKVNGCILFKITKKNAEDILSLKTGGERIFHIIRVFEERDSFGKVLSVTDEVEVYNGKWGDDSAFNSFTTENKVDLLTKSLAAQVDKNATQLNEYKDLLEKYNAEVEKNSNLEKEIEALRAEIESLQAQLNEYMGDTHDGTLLSTDTKYIAFENTLDNISFTEEQYKNAMDELLSKGSVDLSDIDSGDDESTIELELVIGGIKYDNVEMFVYKNNGTNEIFSARYDDSNLNNKYTTTVSASHSDIFKFVSVGGEKGMQMRLVYEYDNNSKGFDGAVNINADGKIDFEGVTDEVELSGMINYFKDGELIDVTGSIGKLKCYITGDKIK